MLQNAFPVTGVEFDAALLQAAITLGVGLYSLFLYRRYRKPYFLWFAIAWLLFVLRLVAIIAFLLTTRPEWLYWHQVATGWTALALLWAAVAFSRGLRFRWLYLIAALFPVAWSYVAIYTLDNFLLAAGPAVLFLSGVTAWTGWIFFRYWRRVHSPGAGLLALALGLWSLHHLDYPFLRARGAWSPWGYYVDIALILSTAAAMTVLVLDELRGGLQALSALSGASAKPPDATTAGERDEPTDEDVVESLLVRAATLPGTRGAALFRFRDGGVQFLRGVGEAERWRSRELTADGASPIIRAVSSGHPVVLSDWSAPDATRAAFTAVLPIPGGADQRALVVTGDTHDPFAALDETVLVALGARIGDALDSAELTRRLRERTGELTRLSTRMIHFHEDERRRLSRELHDETAQVFTAVKLQLGLLREGADPAASRGLDRALDLVDEGMSSIRSVTETLRPAVLDELGLLAALRSIIDSFSESCGLPVDVRMPDGDLSVDAERELALYRGLQESLTNVARHAAARRVQVAITAENGDVSLRVEDDGRGIGPDAGRDRHNGDGRHGLNGMRDRIEALGGDLSLERPHAGGTVVCIHLPRQTGGA